MNSNPNWHVVYTKPKQERKVLQTLSRMGFRCYCPIASTAVKLSHRTEKIRRPLFQSWVFIFCTNAELDRVKSTREVVNVLYRLNVPAVVEASDIAKVRTALKRYEHVRAVPSVTAASGAASEQTIFLPSINYSLAVSSERELYEASEIPVAASAALAQTLTFKPKRRASLFLSQLSGIFAPKQELLSGWPQKLEQQ